LLRELSRARNDLSIFSVWMIRVATAKEASATVRSLKEHAISPRVWRAIGDAMLHYVNINAGAKRFVNAFAPGTLNYFLDGEVGSLGVFAV
jgi:hypothetical protein